MITINAAFSQREQELGLIGRRGENGTRQIAFDCGEVLAEYPGASIVCAMQRQGDLGAYLKECSTNGSTRIIAISDADVSIPGQMRIELRALVGDKRVKSAIYTATVAGSLIGQAETPDSPVADTLDKLEGALSNAQAIVAAVQAKLDNGEFVGAQGPQGPQGPQGEPGAKGDTGAPGKDGAKGEDGKNFRVLGTYATLAALQAAVTAPVQGDYYNVGDAAPHTIYMWDTAKGWQNQGQLQGPTGAKGDPGAKGDTGTPGADGATFTPAVSEAGVLSWTNNKSLTNPASVNIKGAKGDKGDNGSPGEKGEPGTPGAKGDDGVSPTITVSKTGKVTTLTITDKDGTKTATINDGADGTGAESVGDMQKAIYDANGDGIVDDAAKLGGQLPAYYAKASDLSGKVSVVEGKGLSTNDYTTTEKEKLAAIEAGAQKNVVPTWTSVTGKPTTFTPADHTHKQADITGLETALAGKVSVETGKGLSSNDYTDDEKTKLAGIAEGAQKNVQADWNATTGDAAIKNKPTIPTVPTKVSSFENDAGYLTSYTETDPTVPAWAKAESKPAYTASEVGAEASGAVNTHNASESAHSALFTAKQDKITATGLLKGTSSGITAATASHTHTAANITGLATVATSGAYGDLSGKPAIPTIYAYTVSLTAAGWDATEKTQTVTAAHVTADNLVQVSPAETSFEAWQTAQVRCTTQGAGTLTFVCGGDAPTDAVTYNVVVTDGVTA